MARIYSIQEILETARAQSPFYRQAFAKVPEGTYRLEAYPILDQTEFWKANTFPQGNRVLTSEVSDALVFKSGGTTGRPKFSLYTREEWASFTELFGWGMSQSALRKGDRVANLFYAGDLYASFLFIHGSLERASCPSVILPLSGSAPVDSIVHALQEIDTNVLAGVPTTLVSLANSIQAKGLKFPQVRRILFGGEALYEDQARFLQSVFPAAQFHSIGYASVDGGLLGYADSDCAAGEHRCFEDATIMEIVDEATHEPIEEPARPGRLLLTNLTRKLMPLIRYPVGDRAYWIDPPGTSHRKFMLLGRSEEAARVGPASLYYDDLRIFINEWATSEGIQDLSGFQIVVTHEDQKDVLTLRIGSPQPRENRTTRLVEALLNARPMLQDLVDDEMIGFPRVEWCAPADLKVNARTGKLQRVLDRRSKT